jgi:hypothetical protein
VIFVKASWTDTDNVRWQQVIRVNELEVSVSKIHDSPEALALHVAKLNVARHGGCAGGITVRRTEYPI